ncbi:hypothetical protein [Flavihumibacter fluvii]|uniref:hypothetical protein n=1 Tax=Flavihumibacter fluvii TaxID=2838157 RepID=UPI001BDDF22C|nr:hypothetical protein [Flavihumibacter fluvii]ULQ52042.1 hypothetical protein KJS93_18275 [Flavihumibacter fluvii]
MPNLSTERKNPSVLRKVKLSKKPQAPTLTKVLPMNPFANWIMPPEPKQYIKHKDRDCL